MSTSKPLRSAASVLSSDFDSSKIKLEKLDLTPILMTKGQTKLAFVLRKVLTDTECEDLIKLSEDTGYSPAVINGSEGQEFYIPDFRGGQRLLMDDREFADKLLQRIGPFLPSNFQDEKLVEINERLRFLKYSQKGEKFAPHCDGAYTRPDWSATTLITLQLYLNQGFKGGNTTFMRHGSKKSVGVVPRTGSVLVFEHRILHEGSKLKSGQKYTIRMDVLYTHTPSINVI